MIAMKSFLAALLISFGTSLSIGTARPLRFQISMFCRFLGCTSRCVYTSLKRWKQDASATSRFTYRTFPWVHCQLSHLVPSAIAIASSMSSSVLPALDGPERSIFCPCLRIPSINGGDSSGRLSQTDFSVSGSGRSSLTPSIYSFHSVQLLLPMLVSIRNCLCPFRTTPGMRDSRDGFLFCWSIWRPFFLHMVYRKSTLSRYVL